MTIKTHALRFRIWQYAAPRGWDVTFSEVADAVGSKPNIVGIVARQAGWVDRFRANPNDITGIAHASGASGYYAKHLADQIIRGRVGVDE